MAAYKGNETNNCTYYIVTHRLGGKTISVLHLKFYERLSNIIEIIKNSAVV